MFADKVSVPQRSVAKTSLVTQQAAGIDERLAIVNADNVVKHPSELECRATHATADVECPLRLVWL